MTVMNAPGLPLLSASCWSSRVTIIRRLVSKCAVITKRSMFLVSR